MTKARLDENVWTHVVVTWDSATGTCFVYFNGRQVSKNSVAKDARLATNGVLLLAEEQDGARYETDPKQAMQGSLDELYVFDTALAAEQVRALYGTY